MRKYENRGGEFINFAEMGVGKYAICFIGLGMDRK